MLVSYCILFLFFVALNLIIFSLKRNRKEIALAEDKVPQVSVLVAMKNEEKNIPSLLEALARQNYPKLKFEVVLIDDNSSDNSVIQARKFAGKFSHFKIISAKEKPYPAKKGALAYGLEHCSNEFVALTDADCIPSENWLKGIADSLKSYDIVFGAAPLKPAQNTVSKFASYESGKNQILNLLGLKLNIPISATGRNFAYKKSIITESGGYGNTLETLSGDDDLLLREALKREMRIGFIEGEKTVVISNAPEKWSKYFKQRARHLKTSHHYLAKQKLFSFFYFFADIISTLSFLLIFYKWQFVFLALLKIKIAYSNHKRHTIFFGTDFSFPEILLFELMQVFLIPLNFLLSIFFREKWK